MISLWIIGGIALVITLVITVLPLIGYSLNKKVRNVLIVLAIISFLLEISLEYKDYFSFQSAKMVGLLKSGRSEDTVKVGLEFGNSGVIFFYMNVKENVEYSFFPFSDDFNKIPLYYKLINGRLYVSATFYDRNGKVLAEINNNEWIINPNNIFDRNYSKNALEVIDQKNDVVVQIEIKGNLLKLQTILYDKDGGGIAIWENENGCGGATDIWDSNIDEPEEFPDIYKIFKYPSKLHFGERIPRPSVLPVPPIPPNPLIDSFGNKYYKEVPYGFRLATIEDYPHKFRMGQIILLDTEIPHHFYYFDIQSPVGSKIKTFIEQKNIYIYQSCE